MGRPVDRDRRDLLSAGWFAGFAVALLVFADPLNPGPYLGLAAAAGVCSVWFYSRWRIVPFVPARPLRPSSHVLITPSAPKPPAVFDWSRDVGDPVADPSGCWPADARSA